MKGVTKLLTASIEWHQLRLAPILRRLEEGITELKRAARKAKRIRSGDQRRDDVIDGTLLLFLRPIFAAGLVHVALFGALMLHSVWSRGTDLVALLLLDPRALQLPSDYLSVMFPILSSDDARPLAYALGLFYGAIGVTAALMLLSCGAPKLIIASNGVFIGYIATAAIASNSLLIPATAVSGMAFMIKLGYVMLGFYLSLALPRLIGGRGYAKEKYEILLSGTYGLFSGWVLARGFGAEAAVFSGAMFLFFTFCTMGLFEFAFTKILRIFIALTGSEGRKAWNILSVERGYTWKAVRSACLLGSREDKRLFLLLLAFLVSWPFLLAVIYLFVLEGKA